MAVKKAVKKAVRPADGGAKSVTPRKEFEPVKILGAVTVLPPASSDGIAAQVINAAVEQAADPDAPDAFVEVDPSGRDPKSFQSSIQSSARRRGITLQTRTRDGHVYVRVAADKASG